MKNLRIKSPLLFYTVLTTFILLAFTSCKKDEAPQEGNMTVYLTDAPGDFEKVNIDVRAVEVHYSNSDSVNGWVTLPTNAGIYDLLLLRDSLTEVIATGTKLNVAKINQMRLILGPNNTVVVESEGTFPLTIPSSMQTGIKININSEIRANTTLCVTLDFDAAASINKTGNGEYKLGPVIKVKDVTYK